MPRTIIRGLLVQLSQEKIENVTLVTYCGRSFFCLFVLYIKKNVEVNGSECHSAVRKVYLTVASIFLLFVLICFSFFFYFYFFRKKRVILVRSALPQRSRSGWRCLSAVTSRVALVSGPSTRPCLRYSGPTDTEHGFHSGPLQRVCSGVGLGLHREKKKEMEN